MTYTRHTYQLLKAATILVVGVAAFVAASSHTDRAGASTTAQAGCQGSYGWPVKPFDKDHPVRGSFGDPRTLFKAPPTLDGLMSGDGSFSFHQGVDISAPDDTQVFPVANGVVTKVTPHWVRVDCGNGRAFEYWHIRPEVKEGERVEQGQTVLGRITKPSGHVHLTQIENRRVVNPLVSGRLTPYADSTVPQVDAITLRTTETGRDEMPNFVRGSVLLLASAFDTPDLAVPGIWHGLPVTPALITWHIQSWTGKVVVPEQIARDVRATVPANTAFWSYYARGSYQNMAVFGKHYSYLEKGCYLFKLTRTPFDTRQLRDGVYDLVVSAADIRSNTSSRSLRITVHNRPGWIGS